jgi:hypothetical protein
MKGKPGRIPTLTLVSLLLSMKFILSTFFTASVCPFRRNSETYPGALRFKASMERIGWGEVGTDSGRQTKSIPIKGPQSLHLIA